MASTAKMTTGGVIALLVLLLGLFLIFRSFVIVQPGYRGIVLSFGSMTRILEEGFHFKNPIMDRVVVMEVRVQKYEVETASASRDLQMVSSTIALNYRLDASRIEQLYSEVGRDYEVNIIRPAIEESVKAGTAVFTAEELVSRRQEVKEHIKKELSTRLGGFYIIVADFSIVNFDFSEEFNKAIEMKQVAEQRSQQATNDLKRIQTEAQQQIETAKAQAESTKLQAEALAQGGAVIELRRAEALLEMAQRWDGRLPETMIVGEGAALPLLNL